MKRTEKNPQGTSVIEVLLALSMAAIIFISVGKVLATVQSTNTVSRQKEEAFALAREQLEIATQIQHDAFGCACSTDDCITTPGTCIRSDIGITRSCVLPSIYTSCWTQYPVNLSSLSPLHAEEIGGAWTLVENEEEISGSTAYTRRISIENLSRDANGILVEAGGTEDSNSKRITSVVTWESKGKEKNVSLTTILTAWQNQ